MGIALVFLAVLIKSFMARYGDIRKISARIFFSILIILFSYRCLTNIVPNIYTYFGDDYSKMENMPAWHTLYVGLGWEENKYGITWNDACGTEAAQKIDPDVIPNSKEYHELIKQVYLSLVKEDPLYILQSYIRKMIACIKVNINYIWKSPYFLYKGTLVFFAGILLLFNKFVLKKQKQFKANYILIFGTIFCGIQSLVFPMIATIADQYLTGSFAAGDLLLFIMFVIGISNFCNAIRERRQTRAEIVP